MPHTPICPHCKKEIPANMVQQGGLHMNCHEVEIDVWFVSQPDAPKNGYYEEELGNVMLVLESAEEPYIVERKQMVAGLYYNLPDFPGF